MLKALFKKQFLELNTFYFQDRKTGKLRSKKKTILTIVLYALLMVYLGVMFFFMSRMLSPLLYTKSPWLYYSLTGIIAILLGVFGSVFNTYAGLYHAKDNELLLSMPIPPSNILLVRIFGVALMAILFESVVIIPAIVQRFQAKSFTVTGAVFSVLLVFVILLVIVVFTCILGWIVALLASKFKNKSFLTVIFALVFFALYYYFFSQSVGIVQSLVTNSEAVGSTIKTWMYPIYLMGMAGEGHVPSMLLFTLFAVLIFALTWLIMSKTFVSITTRKEATAKKVYREKTVKAAGADRALFRKELRRFTSSANYMLNTALGSVFMLIAAAAMLIYKDKIAIILPMFEGIEGLSAIVVVAASILTASMNDITAPSVSLEGKNIWIAQSMPVPTVKVLDAKKRLHRVITVPPAIMLTIASAIVFELDFETAVFALLTVVVFVLFTSSAGLALNLKRPNLTWTNETIPVKQGLAPTIMILGGMALSALFCLGAYFLVEKLGADAYILIFAALLIIASRLIDRWISTKGAKIFEEL